ncbi:MAG: uracil-DNA glycosylase [Vicinamibacterales bacterium]
MAKRTRLDDVRDHLEFFQELGVAGVGRDATWRRRRAAGSETGAAPDDQSTPDRPAAPSGRDGVVERPSSPESAATAVSLSQSLFTADGQVTTSSDRTLPDIRAWIGECTRCKLHTLGRKQIVFGVGNPEADLMFVGEAPGRDEDIQGEPFVGRAGQLLTKIIEAIGLTRDLVYIANVIKCRPPENRNPEPDEVTACEPFLFAQIKTINPKVIVALGSFAARAMLRTDAPISKIRGRVYTLGSVKLVATFHPAFLLRSPDRKRDTWEDMKKVRALLNGEDAS